MTDGCTGFWLAEWVFPAITQCCAVHDEGGSNGTLLDCLELNLPGWAYVIAAFCVALMILVRPIYRALKPNGDCHARHSDEP